eukprot:m.91372 g.91372  ORF g.91372 m.91372 type:complete len:1030 (+) comp16489_c0_seq2:196-3285(+)
MEARTQSDAKCNFPAFSATAGVLDRNATLDGVNDKGKSNVYSGFHGSNRKQRKDHIKLTVDYRDRPLLERPPWGVSKQKQRVSYTHASYLGTNDGERRLCSPPTRTCLGVQLASEKLDPCGFTSSSHHVSRSDRNMHLLNEPSQQLKTKELIRSLSSGTMFLDETKRAPKRIHSPTKGTRRVHQKILTHSTIDHRPAPIRPLSRIRRKKSSEAVEDHGNNAVGTTESSALRAFESECSKFLPNVGYIDLIEQVRSARLEKRVREERDAQKRDEKARLQRQQAELRQCSENARLALREQESEQLQREATTRCIIEQRQRLEEQHRAKDAADVQRRADLSAQARHGAATAERERIGPLSCADPSVGITIIKHEHPRMPGTLRPGIYIASIAENSLAHAAGLVCGDVIVEVNGRNVTRMPCVKAMALLEQFAPPRVLKLRVAMGVDVGLHKVPTDRTRVVRLQHEQPLRVCTQLADVVTNANVAMECTHLDLRGQGLEALDGDQLALYRSLEVLNVADNALTSLPDSVGTLHATLRRLDVSCNRLRILPVALGSLTHLTSLYVFQNAELAALPDSIGSLQALETLNVPHNALTALPGSIASMTSLRSLWVASNQLTRLPPLSALPNLTKVTLDDNPLDVVPDGLCGCATLRCLSLARCNLKVVPPWMGELHALESLCLAGNHIDTLDGAGIGRLDQLQELDVSGNHLKTLPVTIEALRGSLSRLYLQGNPLRQLPPCLEAFSYLRTVELGFLPGHVCDSIMCCGSLLFHSLDDIPPGTNSVSEHDPSVGASINRDDTADRTRDERTGSRTNRTTSGPGRFEKSVYPSVATADLTQGKHAHESVAVSECSSNPVPKVADRGVTAGDNSPEAVPIVPGRTPTSVVKQREARGRPTLPPLALPTSDAPSGTPSAHIHIPTPTATATATFSAAFERATAGFGYSATLGNVAEVAETGIGPVSLSENRRISPIALVEKANDSHCTMGSGRPTEQQLGTPLGFSGTVDKSTDGYGYSSSLQDIDEDSTEPLNQVSSTS